MRQARLNKPTPAPPAGDAARSILSQSVQLQRRTADRREPSTVPPIVHDVLRSPGQPLDAGTRAFMEPRFGHDFSQVRVHTDDHAAAAASSIDARAFTSSRSIIFSSGEYAPQTESGRRLLAHELTHVVQQAASLYPGGGVGRAGDSYEQQADAVSNELLRGTPTPLPRAPDSARRDCRNGPNLPFTLQKQDDPAKKKASDSGLRLDIRPFELDENPARGAMERAKNLAQIGLVGKKPHRAEESQASLWTAFLAAVERLDKRLTLDAEQSVGLHLYGEGGSSEGSTAAKPTKDVVYLTATGIDLAEMFEIMDVLVLSVSKKSEMFATPEDLKEAPLEVLYDLKEKLDVIKEALEEEEKRAAKESPEPATGKPRVLRQVRELKVMVKIEINKSKGGVEGATKKNEPSKAVKKAPPWTSKLVPPAFHPMSGDQEAVSGDERAPGGQISIYTDKSGTKRKIHHWVDKAGFIQHEVLEVIKKTAE